MNTDIDPVLWNMVEKYMKQITINRATEAGASADLLEKLENLPSREAYLVVDLLYGFEEEPADDPGEQARMTPAFIKYMAMVSQEVGSESNNPPVSGEKPTD